MRKILLPALILLTVCNLRAQFSTSQLQFRIGYNVHNTSSSAVNHLIETFNNNRYPFTVSKNLHSVNWPTGIVVGGNYAFREDMIFYAVFKTDANSSRPPTSTLTVPVNTSFVPARSSLA